MALPIPYGSFLRANRDQFAYCIYPFIGSKTSTSYSIIYWVFHFILDFPDSPFHSWMHQLLDGFDLWSERGINFCLLILQYFLLLCYPSQNVTNGCTSWFLSAHPGWYLFPSSSSHIFPPSFPSQNVTSACTSLVHILSAHPGWYHIPSSTYHNFPLSHPRMWQVRAHPARWHGFDDWEHFRLVGLRREYRPRTRCLQQTRCHQ